MNNTLNTNVWQQSGAAIDMRHVQDHAAQLSLFLGQNTGAVPYWDARAGSETGWSTAGGALRFGEPRER